MGVALDSLVSRLQSVAPARGGVPADYEQLVQDAVLKLAVDCPLIRETRITVVVGTATYALPEDFLFLIRLDAAAGAGQGVIVGSMLTPVSVGFQERYFIEGDSVRFDPTPGYAMTRSMQYAAGYVLVGGAYAALTQNGARLALLYAQSLALNQQAAAASGAAWRYQIGDEMVDKSRTADAVGSQAKSLLDQYQREVAAMRGFGARARYDASGGVLL